MRVVRSAALRSDRGQHAPEIVHSRVIRVAVANLKIVTREAAVGQSGHRVGAMERYHSDRYGGWNRHPWEDAEEISASVFAPWDSVLEVSVSGLRGARVTVVIDDWEAAELVCSTGTRLRTVRPVRQGRHRVAVRWRDLPYGEPEVTAMAVKMKSLAEVEHDTPGLFKELMKHHNRDKFEAVQAVIISFPRGNECHVYGIFSIDKKALASGDPHRDVIKQDFLVYEPAMNRATYYTGHPERLNETYESIDAFCERFGSPHYRCARKSDGAWTCDDHHYRLDERDRLPIEPEFRAAVDAAVERASGSANPSGSDRV